jgi:hypothetical protein
VVKPSSLSETYPQGPLSSAVFYGIISGARLKARQQLDSLSSRYQNSLPSLTQKAKAQPQPSNKGKQKDQLTANQLIDESMNIDVPEDPESSISQPNQEDDLDHQLHESSNSNPIGTSPPVTITQSEDKKKGKDHTINYE